MMKCKTHKGFTLVEILVATTLFFVIISSGLVAFSTFMRYYTFSQNERVALNSVAFAVEEIVREARFAHKYRSETPKIGANQFSHLSFKSQTGNRIHFRKNQFGEPSIGYIESCSTIEISSSVGIDDGCSTDLDPWIPVTDKDIVDIKEVRFKILETSSDGIQQPRIGVFVKGSYTGADGEVKSTGIITQVTQRTLEVQDTSAFRVDVGEGIVDGRIAFIYNDEYQCFDDSNVNERAGICYDIVDGETPCSQASSFPIRITGTTSGVYVLGDNGRVYFISKGVNLGIVSGRDDAVTERVRSDVSYIVNSEETIGLLPGNIKSIHSNPDSKYVYMVDGAGELFIANSDERVEKIEFSGGVGSYRIKNIAVSKEAGIYDYMYIIYTTDLIAGDSPKRYTRVLKINNGKSLGAIKEQLKSAIGSTTCTDLCLVNFSSDSDSQVSRISELSITDKTASARFLNTIVTHKYKNLDPETIFGFDAIYLTSDDDNTNIINFFTVLDSSKPVIFGRKIDGSWIQSEVGAHSWKTVNVFESDQRAKLVYTGSDIYLFNKTDKGGVCRLTSLEGANCTDITALASTSNSAIQGYDENSNHSTKVLFATEFGAGLAVFSSSSIFNIDPKTRINFNSWSKNYALKEKSIAGQNPPPSCQIRN